MQPTALADEDAYQFLWWLSHVDVKPAGPDAIYFPLSLHL